MVQKYTALREHHNFRITEKFPTGRDLLIPFATLKVGPERFYP